MNNMNDIIPENGEPMAGMDSIDPMPSPDNSSSSGEDAAAAIDDILPNSGGSYILDESGKIRKEG